MNGRPTVTPINVNLKENEISYQISDSHSKIIFGELSYKEKIENAVKKSGMEIKKVIFDSDLTKESSDFYGEVFHDEVEIDFPTGNQTIF